MEYALLKETLTLMYLFQVQLQRQIPQLYQTQQTEFTSLIYIANIAL